MTEENKKTDPDQLATAMNDNVNTIVDTIRKPGENKGFLGVLMEKAKALLESISDESNNIGYPASKVNESIENTGAKLTQAEATMVNRVFAGMSDTMQMKIMKAFAGKTKDTPSELLKIAEERFKRLEEKEVTKQEISPQEYNYAYAVLVMSASLGNTEAQYKMAKKFALKTDPKTPGYTEALDYLLEKPAFKGHPKACLEYGQFLLGKKNPAPTKDEVKTAKKYIMDAHKKGVEGTEAELANLYKEGEFVEQDLELAATYAYIAATKKESQISGLIALNEIIKINAGNAKDETASRKILEAAKTAKKMHEQYPSGTLNALKELCNPNHEDGMLAELLAINESDDPSTFAVQDYIKEKITNHKQK